MASSTQDVERILEGLVSIASLCLQEIDLQENFHVMQKLGDGAYGSVLKARDKKTDQIMALKVLDMTKTTESAFLMEFSVSFFLSSHPNIIGCYGSAFKTCEHFGFTQELSLGGDLLSLIPPHDGLPEDTVKRCAVQISSALEFIDNKGLVHLDIKPENILVSDKDCHRLKITDFGLSRVKGTMTRTRSGSKSYMAPEMIQLTGKEALLVDSTLDGWSFGIVLYCLLTGEFPWQAAVSSDQSYSSFITWQNNSDDIEPPSPWSRLPPGVLKMLGGLLATNCNNRSKSTDILMFLGQCWKDPISESVEGILDDEATNVNLSEESGLASPNQESYNYEGSARIPEDVSHSNESIYSLLSAMSYHLTSDSPESESEEPPGDQNDDVLNPPMFMDDKISVHVGAEVEIG